MAAIKPCGPEKSPCLNPPLVFHDRGTPLQHLVQAEDSLGIQKLLTNPAVDPSLRDSLGNTLNQLSVAGNLGVNFWNFPQGWQQGDKPCHNHPTPSLD